MKPIVHVFYCCTVGIQFGSICLLDDIDMIKKLIDKFIDILRIILQVYGHQAVTDQDFEYVKV